MPFIQASVWEGCQSLLEITIMSALCLQLTQKRSNLPVEYCQLHLYDKYRKMICWYPELFFKCVFMSGVRIRVEQNFHVFGKI